MKIPEGYLPVMPYLVVKDAQKFIAFAKDIFSATLRHEHLRSEGVIMHGELEVQQAVIMFCDATEQYPPCNAGMFLYLDNADEIHARVVAGGLKILVGLEDRSYGRGFGFEDEWNNQWWVNTPLTGEG
ncbi:MAG: VOC family protein [Ferruginibacter sp.]|nr:VOC family protein [Ferruginibacter sp.]